VIGNKYHGYGVIEPHIQVIKAHYDIIKACLGVAEAYPRVVWTDSPRGGDGLTY
jgi:hypothetical protein